MSQTILIVDDEPDVLELLSARLGSMGYEVLSAANGQQAVDLAEREQPDLIIMDIMMPEMSGGDAVRILQTKSKTQDIPVVFLTGVVGQMSGGIVAKAINVEDIYYDAIVKPFSASSLAWAIEKHMKRDVAIEGES